MIARTSLAAASAALLFDLFQVGHFVAAARGYRFGGIARRFREPNRVGRLLCLPVHGDLVEGGGQLVCGLDHSGIVRGIANCHQRRLHRLHPCLILGIYRLGDEPQSKQAGKPSDQ